MVQLVASSYSRPRVVVAAALVAALAVSSQPVAADGSVAFADIQDLLDQQPAIRLLLTETLEVAADGLAVRIGSHQLALGGARIGPFVFSAKLRGEPGLFALQLVVCTVPHFLDAEGNPTTFEAAVEVEEELAYVKLAQLGEGPRLDDCFRPDEDNE